MPNSKLVDAMFNVYVSEELELVTELFARDRLDTSPDFPCGEEVRTAPTARVRGTSGSA
jgi:hypothetical protein